MTLSELEHRFYREFERILTWSLNTRLEKEKAFKFILMDYRSFDEICKDISWRTYTGYLGHGYVFGVKLILISSPEPVLEFCPNLDEILKHN